jgi:hypothetical protein
MQEEAMWQERLKAELPEDKVRLLEKYRLVPREINNRIYWVRQFSGKPDHPYITHRGLRKCHTLELVFSFYDLCVAKMTYFKGQLPHYSPCTFDYRSGRLVPCELWDMEFLVQQGTGIVIDLRNLAAISDITVFREMCAWLEQQRDLHERRRDTRTPVALAVVRQRNVPVRRHNPDMHSPHHGGIPCVLV